jgi:type IV pilus assembly protein PilQ
MHKRYRLLLAILFIVGPLLAFGQSVKPPPSRISFDFMDADVRNVLRVLAEVSKKNIVIAEDVKGKVTVKLENVSHDEALDVILKNNDLARIEEETIIRVVTAKKYYEERDRTRKDKVEYLKEKEARHKLEEEFVTETVFINYMDAAEVEKILRGDETKEKKVKGLLSPNGAVSVVKWTNALIIKDTKENVQDALKQIREHDIPPAQVQIEARIVQATADFARELGVAWGAAYRTSMGGQPLELTGLKRPVGSPIANSSQSEYMSPTGQLGMRPSGDTNSVQFPYNVNFPAAPAIVGPGAAGGLGIYIGGLASTLQLDVQISALEASGKAKLISNPKVITSDNQAAKISQGQQIPYQTVSQDGTRIEFKDAVLSLEVTPHVTKDGNIRLKVKATKDRPIEIPGSPVPGIDKKEATSEVIIRDGETAVLGGIYEVEEGNDTTGLPGLKNIPLLGWLFKSESKSQAKRELLIFITPSVLKTMYKVEG